MRERRTAKRISINRKIEVDLDGTLIDAVIINLSTTGALFGLSDGNSDKLTKRDLGREVSFKIKPKNRPTRKYTGEILRIYFQDEILHFALGFWEKYVEIS